MNATARDNEIAALVAEAERLGRSGQRDAAAAVWERVLALDPGHPRALTFHGLRAFQRGDVAGARRFLEPALRRSPVPALTHAAWGRVLEAEDRLDDALAAFDKALTLDPSAYPVHLDKARIYGRLGRLREQALCYEHALQVAPPQALVAPEMAPVFRQAREAVQRNKAELGEFLQQRLADARSGVSPRLLARFDESLDIALGKQPVYVSRSSVFHVAGLPSIAFFDREDFPWAPAAEACTDAIRAELEQVLAGDDAGFIPYVRTRDGEPMGQFAPLDRNPDWSAYFLWQHGRRIEEHMARCPATVAMLEQVPQVEVSNRAPAAFFSALKPGTHIPPHNGSTNARLTVHLPLVIPPDCAIRVGAHTRTWKMGELLLFDDTIEHEAWNRSSKLRVVLIFDVWNPLLSEAERVLVREALEGIMAYYGYDAPLGDL